MYIRPFRRDDTEQVVALWRDCDLTRPWNDPYKDIERKLTEEPALFLVGESAGRLIGTVMAGFEGHLAGRPFFVGEGLSIAEIALYAYTHMAGEGGFDLSPYPAVCGWLDRVAAQPGHVAIAA